GCPQSIGVKTCTAPHSTATPASVAEMHCHHLVSVARHDPHRRTHAVAWHTQLDDISLCSPSFAAVPGLSRAALSQVSFVMGLGSSCNQPLLAKRPSHTVGSGWNSSSRPGAVSAGTAASASQAVCNCTSWGGKAVSAMKPLCSAVRQNDAKSAPWY